MEPLSYISKQKILDVERSYLNINRRDIPNRTADWLEVLILVNKDLYLDKNIKLVTSRHGYSLKKDKSKNWESISNICYVCVCVIIFFLKYLNL